MTCEDYEEEGYFKGETMTFQEAKERIKQMAESRCSSACYEETLHTSGNETVSCKLYIEDLGYTDPFRSWEEAFTQMERMKEGRGKNGTGQGPQ